MIAVDAVVRDVSRVLDTRGGLPGDALFSEELVRGAAGAARGRIERSAREVEGSLPHAPTDWDGGDEVASTPNPRSIDAFATTLLVVLLTAEHLVALQIGDGYVVRITNEGSFERLFEPSRGRFANETCFLTSFESLDALAARGHVQTRIAPLGGVAGIALITDGLEPVAMDMRAGGVPHAPFFAGLVDALALRDAEAFAADVDRYLRGSAKIRDRSDDDKTLVLALDASRTRGVVDDRSATLERERALRDDRGAARHGSQS